MTDNSIPFSPTFLEIIDRIIQDQEGGWKLTDQDNWTYAGVTRKTWEEHFHIVLDLESMSAAIKTHEDFIKNGVYHIYWDNYWIPLELKNAPYEFAGMLMSCGVNCGVNNTIAIFDSAFYIHLYNSDVWQKVTPIPINRHKFLNAWQDHYCTLVEINTEHWFEYWKAIDTPNIEHVEPKGPFINDLKGWINRVNYWRL